MNGTYSLDAWPSNICNCACQTYLSGSCCMWPQRTWPMPTYWTTPTYITTTSTNTVGLHEHKWKAVGIRKGDVIQSCGCGDVRRVPVP